MSSKILSWFIFSIIIFSFSCKKSEELPKITIESTTITESNETQTLTLKVFLSRSSSNNIVGKVSTRERSALAEEDFVKQNRTSLEIPAGELEASFTVEILGDFSYEPDEYFFVLFDEISGAEPSADAFRIDILNDDADSNALLQGPDSPEEYAGMDLIWRDEFVNNELNSSNWTQEFGDNWFNNELQTYTDEGRNTWIQNGNLIIEARNEPSPYGGNNQYTSARIITENKFEFQYGRVDIRAAMPEGQGLWPALWTLGANISEVSWPKCGEIDILEMLGGGTENIAHNALHWQGDVDKESHGNAYTIPSGSLHGEFHVYSIIWDETSITYLIDNVERDVINIEASDMTEFHLPHFLIMNVAVGGDWPGSPDATTVFPQQMIVDYVRVFQKQ